MLRKQNVIFFSSGVSEKNGILSFVKTELENLNYNCSFWRDLFADARDMQNIALLPMLIKKIPTFDFAVLICEGHDTTMMLRDGQIEEVATMRDNVLFEIGLCTMALGNERTILLTDGYVRLPDDLQGTHNRTAVKVITYSPEDVASYFEASVKLIEHIENEIPNTIKKAANGINEYIQKAWKTLSPTVIGASVSTANGYVSNFVLRMFEKINCGVQLADEQDGKLLFFKDEKIFLHIVLPQEFSHESPSNGRKMLRRLKKGCVPAARFRQVEFRYKLLGDELHIYDYPTTLVTSYQTARMILKIDADDNVDQKAEKRFNAKEFDLFENALNVLLTESFIREIVKHFYEDDTLEEEEALIKRLSAMMDRVIVEREDY